MIDLKNLDEIKKLDPQNAFESTELLLKQCQTAWRESKNLSLLDLNGKINNIIFCGMGASIYGAIVLKALFEKELDMPIELVSDYNLPKYVNENSLVVLTSYSGTTEEVLSTALEARNKKAKMVILTLGGQLEKFAKVNNIPAYIFDGKLNPSNAPRLGCGYTCLGLLGMFSKMGLINIEEAMVQTAFKDIESSHSDLKAKAMKDSETFMNKIPIIIASEQLSANAQILRNQFNETAKTFSCFFLIPDLNHHLMEGLKFPQDTNLQFIIFQSPNYPSKISKRVELTIDVIKKNSREVFQYQTQGKNTFEDFLEVLICGSYLTLFLALRHDQNPATNPWVDYFKKQLSSK